jgi:radical SAM protein with 4Fe4S-binding SPASM domain
MECEQIVELGYGEFSKRLSEKVAGKRIPIKGGIDITSRCNLRCAHCYIGGTSLCSEHELTYEEICNIFDQIADEGCLWLLITGGEPLLRPDFADIYRYAKRKGFIITLFTNATLLTPRIADLLGEEKPFNIEISLYGMTADTYEQVTGVPGSFQRCLRGINLLLKRKLPLQLKSVAMTLNYHELQDMKRYAGSLGLKFRFDPLINARLDGSTEPTRLRLSPAQVVALDLGDEARCRELRELCDRFWGTSGSDRLYTCGAGIKNFHITSTGNIVECIIGRRTDYNIRHGTFHQGFHEAIPKVLAQKRTRQSECQRCAMESLCGSCSAMAELENGDPEAKVDWLCEVAHLRAAAFKTGWARRRGHGLTKMTTPVTPSGTAGDGQVVMPPGILRK